MMQNKPNNLLRSWALTSLLSLPMTGCSDQDASQGVEKTQSQDTPVAQLLDETPDRETLSTYMRTVDQVSPGVLVITQESMDHIAQSVRENLSEQDMEANDVNDIVYTHQIELIKHAYEKIGVSSLDEDSEVELPEGLENLPPEMQQQVISQYKDYGLEIDTGKSGDDAVSFGMDMIAEDQWKRLQQCSEIEVSERTSDVEYVKDSLPQEQKDCSDQAHPEQDSPSL